MATRKKAKGRTKPNPKAKRKKPRATKAVTRRKGTAVGKNRKIRKRAARKAPFRQASPKKAKPTAKVAVEATKADPAAEPVVAKPMPSQPAQSAPPEERIGFVTHYYSHVSVATLRLESGRLRVGDVIHIRGNTTDFSQKVESLEVNHAPVTEVGPNDDFGLKVVEHAREHEVVFKVRS
jgi:hypothetical protein